MKPKWVLVLLIVSLAGNAVELGLYARAEWKRNRDMQKFYGWVQSGAETWTLRVVVKEFEPRMQMLESRENRWSSELQWQDYQQPPDSSIDRQALDSIASITRQKYLLMYQSRRALPSVQDAKLRQRMERRWRGQMGIGD
ncbi:MAG: hypothetical protein NTX53_10740 [candidate division WOR-3 bacterium]|nr:hypothetical protein [candidate division WOR-3 bacterium]